MTSEELVLQIFICITGIIASALFTYFDLKQHELTFVCYLYVSVSFSMFLQIKAFVNVEQNMLIVIICCAQVLVTVKTVIAAAVKIRNKDQYENEPNVETRNNSGNASSIPTPSTRRNMDNTITILQFYLRTGKHIYSVNGNGEDGPKGSEVHNDEPTLDLRDFYEKSQQLPDYETAM